MECWEGLRITNCKQWKYGLKENDGQVVWIGTQMNEQSLAEGKWKDYSSEECSKKKG